MAKRNGGIIGKVNTPTQLLQQQECGDYKINIMLEKMISGHQHLIQ
jgi:hypothetical protein